LLAVSHNCKIDVAEVLKYPLTPTPRSLSHSDGTLGKIAKSSLTKYLEEKVAVSKEPPIPVDVTIIDGFFLLHTIGDIPPTFGLISQKFLQMVTRFQSNEIHVVLTNT